MQNLYTKNYAEHVAGERGYAGFRNKLRLKKFTKLVSPKEGEEILEIGPNIGELMKCWVGLGAHCVGIDINPNVSDESLNILEMDATNITLSKESFDKVVSFETLEHIENLEKVFAGVYKVLKKGGTFHFSFPFELFRGQTALGDAWHAGGGIELAREFHLHRLTPSKIKRVIAKMPYNIKDSKIVLIPWPSYFMTLKKG